MKQRFSGREEDYVDGAAARVRGGSEEEDYADGAPTRVRGGREEDYADGAAPPVRGFSKLTKSMKVRGSSSSTTYDHNSLLMSRGRLPEQSSSTTTELSNQEDLNISRRTDQLTELPNHERQPTSTRMYTCKTCGRKFGSFQALGGHRASHSMKLVGQGIVGEDGTYQNYFQYKAKSHRCSICGKGYQTGQSLGGHMRKHRELLDNQRLAASNIVHQQNIINKAANHDQSNNIALKWAQMNAAAIFQYSNHARRYNAPHQVEAGVGIGTETEGGTRETLKEKVPNKKGLNFDLNLDVSENEELGYS